jgi:hypothetical protein
MALALVGFGLLVTLVGCEVVLRGTKLQTGLSRVLVVWGALFLVTLLALVAAESLSAVVFTIFWGGAFLSWFGVRSHIESSVLLRMLVLLRHEPLTESMLITNYMQLYGEAARLRELCQGGLAKRVGQTVIETEKGRRILDVVARLR